MAELNPYDLLTIAVAGLALGEAVSKWVWQPAMERTAPARPEALDLHYRPNAIWEVSMGVFVGATLIGAPLIPASGTIEWQGWALLALSLWWAVGVAYLLLMVAVMGQRLAALDGY